MSLRLSLVVSVGLLGWLAPCAIVIGQPVAKSQEQRFAEALASIIRIVAEEHVKPATQTELAAWAMTHIRIKTDNFGKPLAQPKEFSTKGMTVERAQELLLGPPGSALSLMVVRSR